MGQQLKRARSRVFSESEALPRMATNISEADTGDFSRPRPSLPLFQGSRGSSVSGVPMLFPARYGG